LRKKLFLIGASTGAPTQITQIIKSLKTLNSNILIVQHMRQEMLPSFYKSLKDSTSSCVEKTPFENAFEKPCITVCTASTILKQEYGTYSLIHNSSSQMYVPDIDKLFLSFENFMNEFDIEIFILSGIGRDGTNGAKVLKEKGAKVYAASENSCVVFGMPQAVINEGIVDRVMDFDDIVEYIKRHA
jgi:two-component system chemotaxis response regulator CheB